MLLLLSQDGGCILETIDKPEFSLMGNFLCCDGQPGKVSAFFNLEKQIMNFLQFVEFKMIF